jgi:hypothetical protein
VLTAIAAEGFERFTDALEAAGDDFYDVGVAYVRFAIDHQAYFTVMFRPDLYRADDPDVQAASRRANQILMRGAERLAPVVGSDARTAGIAAWSIAHGFAQLWLSGALPDEIGQTPEQAARPVLQMLFGDRHPGSHADPPSR